MPVPGPTIGLMEMTHEPMPPYQPVPDQSRRRLEPPELTYARHTRNAVVFMAVVLALSLVTGLVAGIVAASHHPALAATCQSQGGTDPSC
jgi:hypothetical protein